MSRNRRMSETGRTSRIFDSATNLLKNSNDWISQLMIYGNNQAPADVLLGMIERQDAEIDRILVKIPVRVIIYNLNIRQNCYPI